MQARSLPVSIPMLYQLDWQVQTPVDRAAAETIVGGAQKQAKWHVKADGSMTQRYSLSQLLQGFQLLQTSPSKSVHHVQTHDVLQHAEY